MFLFSGVEAAVVDRSVASAARWSRTSVHVTVPAQTKLHLTVRPSPFQCFEFIQSSMEGPNAKRRCQLTYVSDS